MSMLKVEGLNVYYGSIHAIKGISFEVNEGEIVTLIGANGAGKSTMLNAVAGTWMVDEGQILIDGIDVTKLSEHKRATYLGRVFQDPMTGTAATMGIEENLALAKRRGKTRLLKPGITKAERQEYKELLKILGLGLEDRLTSKVGLLSGGQRQRIAIARALIRDPEVIVLDEATSALDSISEKLIQEALENLTKGRTTFIVAHRLSTIRDADKIAVLADGHCVEYGTFEELMARKGEFYRMKMIQS